MISNPRSGYTLPVFACASAIAALRWLQEDLRTLPSVSLNLVEPPETAEIPIEQVARLSPRRALAISRSDPGDNLDLTRHTPVWAVVELEAEDEAEGMRQEGGNEATERQQHPFHPSPSPLQRPCPILLEAGEGIGRQIDAEDRPAIYAYARRLLETNLVQYLRPGQRARVQLILPEGRSLAERTSNAAFGVVEGLSLLGTSGISQPLSAPGQLEEFRALLCQKAARFEGLVFCVGENGLDLAARLGVERDRLVKTANWLGPLLVEAGLQGIQSILLFGYHGKLIKLAGGIFHTHHHVADGRREIFAAHCGSLDLPVKDFQIVFESPTVEDALNHLRQLDADTGSRWVDRVYQAIAQKIDQRSSAYIQTHSDRQVQVGSVLFDRDRRVIVQSEIGATLLSQFVKLS